MEPAFIGGLRHHRDRIAVLVFPQVVVGQAEQDLLSGVQGRPVDGPVGQIGGIALRLVGQQNGQGKGRRLQLQQFHGRPDPRRICAALVGGVEDPVFRALSQVVALRLLRQQDGGPIQCLQGGHAG